MSTFIWILIVLVVAMSVYLLVYTLTTVKGQKAVKGKYDSTIDDSVKERPYLLNPIFVSLAVSTVLVVGLIFYYAFK